MNLLSEKWKKNIRSQAERLGMKRGWNDISSKPRLSFAVFVVAGLIGSVLGIRAGVLWGVFIAFAIYDWESRLIGGAAILSLVACPFLLQVHLDAWADVMAVYAYFFLLMLIGLQMIERKRYPERFSEEI